MSCRIVSIAAVLSPREGAWARRLKRCEDASLPHSVHGMGQVRPGPSHGRPSYASQLLVEAGFPGKLPLSPGLVANSLCVGLSLVFVSDVRSPRWRSTLGDCCSPVGPGFL